MIKRQLRAGITWYILRSLVLLSFIGPALAPPSATAEDKTAPRPPAPRDAKILGSGIKDDQQYVALSWMPVARTKGFYIYLYQHPPEQKIVQYAIKYPPIGARQAIENAFKVDAPGHYCFQIIAYNVYGKSAPVDAGCTDVAANTPTGSSGESIGAGGSIGANPPPASSGAAPPASGGASKPRQEGDFYELRTPFKDEEVYPGPLIRKCGGSQNDVQIRLAGTNRFNAAFRVNGRQVGPAWSFTRYVFSSTVTVGGAAISQKRCSIGAIVDGRPGDPSYRVVLIDTVYGRPLSQNFAGIYPKVHRAGGIIEVEPRVWFSPDDTIVMIITAAPEESLQSNSQAIFIDTISGNIIKMVSFRWPARSIQPVPYSAKVINSGGTSQVYFSVPGIDTIRVSLP